MNHPLRLAVGSHKAGSGKGCAMNVISWESGDSTITDMPACADPMLARIVQQVNDAICTHRDGDLLCPSCSVLVLDLGHRIVGTGTHPLAAEERHKVWVWVASDQARQVAHLNPDPRVMAAIVAAEGWCKGRVTIEEARAAANAAYAANADAAAKAAYAAIAAADAAYAAIAAADAAAKAAYAAYAAYGSDAPPSERLRLAHRAVDVWCERAGFTPTTTDPTTTTKAVAKMLVRV